MSVYDVTADHHNVGIEQTDGRRQHTAQGPTRSGHDPYGIGVSSAYQLDNITHGGRLETETT